MTILIRRYFPFSQAPLYPPVQIPRLGRADHVDGRPALPQVGAWRAVDVGEGEQRGEVTKPRQVHKALQRYELLVQVNTENHMEYMYTFFILYGLNFIGQINRNGFKISVDTKQKPSTSTL